MVEKNQKVSLRQNKTKPFSRMSLWHSLGHSHHPRDTPSFILTIIIFWNFEKRREIHLQGWLKIFTPQQKESNNQPTRRKMWIEEERKRWWEEKCKV